MSVAAFDSWHWRNFELWNSRANPLLRQERRQRKCRPQTQAFFQLYVFIKSRASEILQFLGKMKFQEFQGNFGLNYFKVSNTFFNYLHSERSLNFNIINQANTLLHILHNVIHWVYNIIHCIIYSFWFEFKLQKATVKLPCSWQSEFWSPHCQISWHLIGDWST